MSCSSTPSRRSPRRECAKDLCDAGAAVAQSLEQAALHRVGSSRAVTDGRRELGVRILQMHVADPAGVLARDSRRVCAADEDVARVEAERHVAVAEHAIDGCLRLDDGAHVWMERRVEPRARAATSTARGSAPSSVRHSSSDGVAGAS